MKVIPFCFPYISLKILTEVKNVTLSGWLPDKWLISGPILDYILFKPDTLYKLSWREELGRQIDSAVPTQPLSMQIPSNLTSERELC